MAAGARGHGLIVEVPRARTQQKSHCLVPETNGTKKMRNLTWRSSLRGANRPPYCPPHLCLRVLPQLKAVRSYSPVLRELRAISRPPELTTNSMLRWSPAAVEMPTVATSMLSPVSRANQMKRSIVWLLAVVVPASLAHAQTQADFVTAFAGKWQSYDRHLGVGKAWCEFDLSALATDNKLPLTMTNCAPPLVDAKSWSIEGGQLGLYDDQGNVIAKLGGNQRRVSGATTDGKPIVLERAGGDGYAASLQADYNASGCYYLGYTQNCAPQNELAEPPVAPDGQSRISVQVNLKVHDEPRTDSTTVGVVKEGTCVTVQSCIMASDGPWCRAKFENSTGWLRKLVVRQNRWAVVAFTNSCSS
jgi:Protease inhibitor Inh